MQARERCAEACVGVAGREVCVCTCRAIADACAFASRLLLRGSAQHAVACERCADERERHHPAHGCPCAAACRQRAAA